MDLLVPLNSRDDRPLYEQIYQYIKDEIRCGNIKPQKKLPSSRELAKNLKVSRSTTQLAYEQLVSEGYLEAIPRKGYYSAKIDGVLPPVSTVGKNWTEVDHEEEVADEGNGDIRDDQAFSEWNVDFSPRGIDLDGFPFSTWRKISRAVLKEEEKDLFLKGNPQGDLSLRNAIRDYLHSSRGVKCSADQIVVGAGNEYLLMLLSQILGRESQIAMENPTYEQAYRVLSGMGHVIYPVEMDKSGFMVSELRGYPADIAYVMPAHQFPMGIVMPVKRRQELLQWAKEKDGRYIIEDDYDSEFRYKGKPIPALQGMDTDGRVIYMGTFSRAIAPAIRVGYLVLPPKLLAKYREQARFYSSTVSRVDQKILAQFIEGGYFERHLNRMREIYKGKHDCLMTALRPMEDQFEIEGEFAGLHVLLTCKKNIPEEVLVKAAAEAGVRVYGLSGFYIHKQTRENRNTIILGYAKLKDEKLKEGAKLLGEAFRTLG
ncbi:MAG: PLP-dependent aminotransferase family protein [Clostridium sp.]|nr:PLP-dependent aminotransferase family protein [Clostridium sp.]